MPRTLPEPPLAPPLAIVTGGSRGIGAATAATLRARGWEVAAVHRSTAPVDAPWRGVPAGQAAISYLRADLATRDGQIQVAQAFGRHSVRALVLCAGTVEPGPLDQLDEDVVERTLALNLVSPLELCRRLLRAQVLVEGNPGSSIVFVTSNLAQKGLAGRVPYSAAKAGLEGATRALAHELGPRGIRVNAVAPGLVVTDMTKAQGPEAFQAYADAAPLGRVGHVDDPAGVIAFVLGPDAAYMTGQVLVVDGGITA